MTDHDPLVALPRCPRRGLPIPYVNLIENGRPDFSVLDSRRVHQAAAERLCGICGEPLGYWITFLGGPQSVSSRAFLDPPMHEPCAYTALRLCPFLVRRDMKRRRTAATNAGTPYGFTEARPEAYLIYTTRGYRFTVTAECIIFRPAPAVRVQRCEYADGRIVLPAQESDHHA